MLPFVSSVLLAVAAEMARGVERSGDVAKVSDWLDFFADDFRNQEEDGLQLSRHARSLRDRDFAARHGVQLLGEGRHRTVFRLADGLVVKVGYHLPNNPNWLESLIWHQSRRFPDVSPYLVPVLAISRDTGWLLMDSADVLDEDFGKNQFLAREAKDEEASEAVLEEAERLGLPPEELVDQYLEIQALRRWVFDLHEQNLGVHQGRLKILDYAESRLRVDPYLPGPTYAGQRGRVGPGR